jgi:hypothetical protein
MWKKDRESGWRAVQVPGAVASRVASQGGSPIYRQMQIPLARGESAMLGQPQTGLTAEQRAAAILAPRTSSLPDEAVQSIIRQARAHAEDQALSEQQAQAEQTRILQERRQGGRKPAVTTPATTPKLRGRAGPAATAAPPPMQIPLELGGGNEAISGDRALRQAGFTERVVREATAIAGSRTRLPGSVQYFPPVLEPLPRGDMADQVMSKPVADGLIEVQRNRSTGEFEVTKHYYQNRPAVSGEGTEGEAESNRPDLPGFSLAGAGSVEGPGGVPEGISPDRGRSERIGHGVGIPKLVDFLNRVQQAEQPLRPSQRSGAGGAAFTSARLAGPETPAKEPDANTAAVMRILDRVRGAQDKAEIDKIIRLAEKRPVIASPKAAKQSAEAEDVAFKKGNLPKDVRRSLQEELASALSAVGEGARYGAKGPRLVTPGDTSVSRAERMAQDVAAVTKVLTRDQLVDVLAQAREADKIPTPAGKVVPTYDTGAREVQRRTTMPEESAFTVKKVIRQEKGGPGIESWQVINKADDIGTNIFINKEGNKYRIYLESGGKLEGLEGYSKDHLINAQNAAIKLAERQHYKEAVTSASFQALGVGKYEPIAPSADGKTMSYRFTPEGSATPVVPEKPMPMEQWDNLARKNGAKLPPKPAERARKVGRPKQNQPQVILKHAAATGKPIRTVDLGATSNPIVEAVKRAPEPGTSRAERDALAAEIAAHRARYYEGEEQP